MKSFIVQTQPNEAKTVNVITISHVENDVVIEGIKNKSLKFDFAVGDTKIEYEKLCYLIGHKKSVKDYHRLTKGEIGSITITKEIN